jgi:hypothetical protein
MRAALDAGLAQVRHPGHQYYIVVPGGQAELRIKVTAALQVDQQSAARSDIGTPVSERVGYLELLAEPVDEVPQFLQRHIMVASVGPQQTRLDEFRPRDIARPCRLDADDRAVAGRAAFEPPVQRRRGDPQQARGGRLGVHLAVEDGDAHAVSVTCRRASAGDLLSRLPGASAGADVLAAWVQRTGHRAGERARERPTAACGSRFTGRVSTEDWQDPVTSCARQQDQARVLAAGTGQS